MRLDLHTHTKYSPDSKSRVRDVLSFAKKTGLDGIAITDHDSIKGYYAAIRVAKKLGLILIPGYELSTSDGELLVYGITELVRPGLSAEESIDLARGMGGVVVAAHPYDTLRHGVGSLCESLKLDGIEVINYHSFSNSKARATAEKLGLSQTGGSDAHLCWEVGNAYTECDDDPITSLKKHKCKAGGGVSLGNIHLMLLARLLHLIIR